MINYVCREVSLRWLLIWDSGGTGKCQLNMPFSSAKRVFFPTQYSKINRRVIRQYAV
jgi:hypothetical protein